LSDSDLRLETVQKLLSGTIHDMNNALSPILLYADLLKEAAHDEPTQKKAVAILDQAAKIQSALESLRILYKDPSEEVCGPAHLAPHFHRLLRPLFQKAGIRIAWWVEKGLPPVNPKEGMRRIEFLAAMAALVHGVSQQLWIVWRRSEIAGSQILVVVAPAVIPESLPPPAGAGSEVAVVDGSILVTLTAVTEAPLLQFNWP
jgi:signal transduction histidine kinase